MKRILFRALVLAVVCALSASQALAQSPAQTSPRSDWKEGFRAHDKNQDGMIDRAEFQEWIVDVFFFRDTNHKGYLVPGDLQDAMSAEKFKAADRNGDGRLTLQEFLNALFQDFAAMDVNRDGAVTVGEIEAYIKTARK